MLAKLIDRWLYFSGFFGAGDGIMKMMIIYDMKTFGNIYNNISNNGQKKKSDCNGDGCGINYSC